MKSIAEQKEPSILSDQQPEGDDDSNAAAGYDGSKENGLEEDEDYD